MADERRLKQVLLNRLTNAIKFTPGGRVVVTVYMEDKREGIRLTVSDDGIGMTTEEIEKVMEPFSQGSGGLSLQERTGLGLPLTRGLIEAHGGRLILDSAPGTGTRVTIILPAAT